MNDSIKIFVASRTFSQGDQIDFAKFSGDFNPIHVDPIVARRTISGQCVVHGIHGFMWALDAFVSTLNLVPSSFVVKFAKPIFLNEEVTCSYDQNTNKLQLIKDSIILTDITLKFDSVIDKSDFKLKSKAVLNSPIERDIDDLRNLPPQDFVYRGEINLMALLFPNLIEAYGAKSCCEIATISEIVGMETPGLHSFFLSARLDFQRNKIGSNFFIEHIDERFNLLKISVNAASFNCKLDAFLRQKPTFGTSIANMRNMVVGSEFRTIKALIIGGSRGLGESVAKLIALGGGESLITYSAGYEDCLKLANNITDSGQKCSVAKIKIPGDLHLLEKLGNFNQIYYFATPKIFGKRSPLYDKTLYDQFYQIYVLGFQKLVLSLINTTNKTAVFYPSSVALNKPLPELSEYIEAKIAGEKLCKELDNFKNIKILSSRIPRTKTGQTMSLIEVESEKPEDVMLPLIRTMLTLI